MVIGYTRLGIGLIPLAGAKPVQHRMLQATQGPVVIGVFAYDAFAPGAAAFVVFFRNALGVLLVGSIPVVHDTPQTPGFVFEASSAALVALAFGAKSSPTFGLVLVGVHKTHTITLNEVRLVFP